MSTVGRGKGRSQRRQDWVEAGLEVLASAGIEAVRIEVLARKLRISKGSFYWHFADRGELLDAMLAKWEEQEAGWFASDGGKTTSPAERWARLVEHIGVAENARLDVAAFAWARRDPRVAVRVAAVEEKRGHYIAQVLGEIGFTAATAEEWSEMALLVSRGWVDRGTRDAAFRKSRRPLGHWLSQLILAASALTSEAAR